MKRPGRTTWILLASAATASCRGEPSPRADLPANVAILPSSAGPEMMNQCSRSTPPHEGGFWEPSASAVRNADRLLSKLARSNSQCRPDTPIEASARQYIGIISNGQRLLYVNTAWRMPDWMSKPVIICDGGSSVWGAFVDPEKGRVVSIQFNGGFGPGPSDCEPKP